jgi:predicted dehydrogenase
MTPAEVREIGVGMLGYAFMGKAHSNAYRKLAYISWPPPLAPRLVAIAGRNARSACPRRLVATATRAGRPTGGSS